MQKDLIRGDRRLQRRYPIQLELEYKIIRHGHVVASGAGLTSNISSGGIFFQADESIQDGPVVELLVRWPAVLGRTPFLDLCIEGRLIRNDGHGVAVRMSKYNFQRPGDLRGAFEELFTSAVIQ